MPSLDEVDCYAVTIPSGASTSGAVFPLGVRTLVNVVLPSPWTPAVLTVQGVTMRDAAAATLSTSASAADQNTWPWASLHDVDGNEFVLQAVAGRAIQLAPQDLLGWWALRLRSGLAGAAVAQGADRAIAVTLQRFG